MLKRSARKKSDFRGCRSILRYWLWWGLPILCTLPILIVVSSVHIIHASYIDCGEFCPHYTRFLYWLWWVLPTLYTLLNWLWWVLPTLYTLPILIVVSSAHIIHASYIDCGEFFPHYTRFLYWLWWVLPTLYTLPITSFQIGKPLHPLLKRRIFVFQCP